MARWIKDAKHIAYIDERFGEFELTEGADSISFTPMEKHFSKDKKHIYYCSKQLPLCDPDSFEFIANEGVFARDKTHVYNVTDLIKDADSQSLHIINDSHCRDNKHNYTMRDLL